MIAAALSVTLAASGAGQDLACPKPSTARTVYDGPWGSAGEWQLRFADEFDAVALDPGKWTTCYWWNEGGCTNPGTHELQWYQPANLSVGCGDARLQARREPTRSFVPRSVCPECVGPTWFAYTSALLSTGSEAHDAPPRFVFRYGFAEMRAWIPAGRGLFPGFWLLPASQEPMPEVDIMAVVGHRPDLLHTTIDAAAGSDGATTATVDLSAGWHVYGLEWTAQALVWYLDGVPVWRYAKPAAIPQGPMYLVINLAVGGSGPGLPDSATRFPADLLVDYVRIWQKTD